MPIGEHDNFKMKKIINKFLTKIFLGVGFVGVNMVIGAVMDEHRKPEDIDAANFNRTLVTVACCTWGFYVIKNTLTLYLIIAKYKKMLLQRHNNMLVANNNNVHDLNDFMNLAKELENIDQKRTKKQQNIGPLTLS